MASDDEPWTYPAAGVFATDSGGLFVASNLLRYQAGVTQPYDTLSPLWSTGIGPYQFAFNATILLGPMIAMAIAALAVLRVSFVRAGTGWTLVLTVRKRWPEIAVLAFGVALVGVVGVYPNRREPAVHPGSAAGVLTIPR